MINDQGSVSKRSVFFFETLYVKTNISIRVDGGMARKQRKWYEGACYVSVCATCVLFKDKSFPYGREVIWSGKWFYAVIPWRQVPKYTEEKC